MEDSPMARTGIFSSNKSLLILVACICFAIGALGGIGRLDWTDLGLFFGFLAFIF
jgi:hypothetical protein